MLNSNNVYAGKVTEKVCKLCPATHCRVDTRHQHIILYGMRALGCYKDNSFTYRTCRKPKNSMELLYLATRLKEEHDREIAKILIRRLIKEEKSKRKER